MRPQPLFAAAAASYAANCALGAAVASGAVDSSGFRWLHHGLYISTCVLSGAAVVVALARAALVPLHRDDDAPNAPDPDVSAALALLPAAVPLAVVPAVSARSRRHIAVALAAAPFFVAALARSRRR